MKKLAAVFVGLAGLFLAGWEVLLFLIQCLYWLRNGQWVSVSVLELFVHGWRVERANLPVLPLDLVPSGLSNSVPWLSAPETWLGLHKMVTAVLGLLPFSMTLIIVGAVVLALSTEMDTPANINVNESKTSE